MYLIPTIFDMTFPNIPHNFLYFRYDPHQGDINPIGVIYNPVLNQKHTAANISWTELFGNAAADKLSIVPSGLEDNEPGNYS